MLHTTAAYPVLDPESSGGRGRKLAEETQRACGSDAAAGEDVLQGQQQPSLRSSSLVLSVENSIHAALCSGQEAAGLKTMQIRKVCVHCIKRSEKLFLSCQMTKS